MHDFLEPGTQTRPGVRAGARDEARDAGRPARRPRVHPARRVPRPFAPPPALPAPRGLGGVPAAIVRRPPPRPDRIPRLMSATLVAKNLAAGHGDRALFSGLDLVVAPGDVIGLVGMNGAGKSTLLRLLAGLERPEEGSVRLSPATATVGHLPQEPERRPGGETVREFLAR